MFTVKLSEDAQIQALEQQVQEISTQIALANLNIIQQKVEIIAQQTQELAKQVALLESPQVPKVFAQELPTVQEASYSASVANAAGPVAGNVPAVLFVLLAGAGIFLLLGGWNLVVPFVRDRMGA